MIICDRKQSRETETQSVGGREGAMGASEKTSHLNEEGVRTGALRIIRVEWSSKRKSRTRALTQECVWFGGAARSQGSGSRALRNECAVRSERSRGPRHVGLWLL